MVLPTVNWVSSVVIFESPENSRLPGRALSRVNPLLVCCVWPGERGYARSAEEALPGRPTAPEGRARPDLVCREAPRLIAHYEEYREADKSDFALQGCSGMKFEVGEPEAIVT